MESKAGYKKLAIGIYLSKNNLIKRIDLSEEISIDGMIKHLQGLKERIKKRQVEDEKLREEIHQEVEERFTKIEQGDK